MNLQYRFRTLAFVTAIVAIGCAIYESQPWKDARFRPAADRKYNSYSETLRNELTTDGIEQLDYGTYVMVGDSDASWIAFGRDRWIFEYRHFRECVVPYDDRTFGTLTRSGDRIQLSPEFPCNYLENDLHIVHWGKRNYLIPSTRFEEFRKAIIDGYERA